MAGTEPRIDRELLGRVAALTPGQQRWLRTVLQAIFTMDEAPVRRRPREERQERRERPASEKPRRQGLDELLKGERAEEEYPELSEELKGIADIADLLRESGSGRRKLGEELMRLFEMPDPGAGFQEEGEEEEDGGARFN